MNSFDIMHVPHGIIMMNVSIKHKNFYSFQRYNTMRASILGYSCCLYFMLFFYRNICQYFSLSFHDWYLLYHYYIQNTIRVLAILCHVIFYTTFIINCQNKYHCHALNTTSKIIYIPLSISFYHSLPFSLLICYQFPPLDSHQCYSRRECFFALIQYPRHRQERSRNIISVRWWPENCCGMWACGPWACGRWGEWLL